MMNDYEEEFDEDFQTENDTSDQFGGVYGANESTAQWTAGSGITAKIPPLYDGSTSWFKYEELIDGWMDLTGLEANKQRPALKNRLVGDAELYKGLLDRATLRAGDGGKYSKDTLRPHFGKGPQSVSCGDVISSYDQTEETSRWSSGLESYHCCSNA